MKRRYKLLAAVLAAALLALLSAVSLARPEQVNPEADNFIGYHLVFAPTRGHAADDPPWEEYGSAPIHAGSGLTVDLPKYRLTGQKQADHSYLFPGLEGYNCFLAVDTERDAAGNVTDTCYSGYAGLADVQLSISDTRSSLSGTLYFGPSLDSSHWNTEDFDYEWSIYNVYQSPDGAVYLTEDHNSYGGVGGFTVTTTAEQTDRVNGAVTGQHTFEVSVKLESIPRPETLTLRQYDGAGQLLWEDSLPAGDVAPDDPQVCWSKAPGLSYAVLETVNTNGSVTRKLWEATEEDGFFTSVWLLDDRGAGFAVSLLLE